MEPITAAIAATLTAAGVGTTTAAIIAQVIVGTLLAAGTSLASRALLGDVESLSDRGQTLSFRAAAAPAQIIYGETRAGGPIVFMTTSGGERPTDNQLLWMAVALAGHEVQEISDVYYSDEIITFALETINPANNLKGPAQGTLSSDPGGGLGQDGGYSFLIKHLGEPSQTAPRNMRSEPYGIGDIITEADRFRGIAYLEAEFTYAPTLFPAGPPNLSALVKGRKIYDPRNPAHDIDDPATWAWSANWALCVADFLRGCPMDRGGGDIIRPYGVGARDDEIDWDSIITAANLSDESVQTKSGIPEARYSCNGMIDSDVPPDEALKALLSAGAGHLAWSGGQWKLFAGAYRTPTVTLTDDDQCGPSRTQAKRARRDLFNGVKGKFRGPQTFYTTTDFPPVANATYVAQDNGEEIWQDIELPFTDVSSACQRIARIELQRNRQQIITERTFKLSALGTQVGDVVQLTDARKGWSAKPFEIHKWSLRTAQDESGQPYLCIDMVLHETASSVYNWTVDDEFAFDDAPDTNLPRPWVVAVPGQPGIVEELYQTRQGSGVKTRVTVSWPPSFEAYLLDYIPEFKLNSASEWTVLPPVTGTTVVINDLAAGLYDFRVKTRNRLGVTSLYSTSTGLTVYGLGATPATLTGLGIQPLGNQAMLAWTQSVDLDVREGGKIEFRHSPALSSVTWDNSTSIRESVPGSETSASVPLKAGTYVIRPVDSSGIPGAITSVTSKQASINGFTALSGSPLTEETTFAGTHTNTVTSSNILKLANAGMWDDIADLDLLATNIDDTGGLSPSGSYQFNNAYDFGAVTKVRLTSKIAGTVTNILANIDDRSDLIDAWDDFDGASGGIGGAADAWVEYRQTDDNPASSPTWTAWMRLDTAEAECRGVQARAQLRSFDPTFNIEIATLQVAAEQRT